MVWRGVVMIGESNVEGGQMRVFVGVTFHGGVADAVRSV